MIHGEITMNEQLTEDSTMEETSCTVTQTSNQNGWFPFGNKNNIFLFIILIIIRIFNLLLLFSFWSNTRLFSLLWTNLLHLRITVIKNRVIFHMSDWRTHLLNLNPICFILLHLHNIQFLQFFFIL